MTYFVADDFDWHEAPSLNAAIDMALRFEREGTEDPVNIFEQVDWHRCLVPDERSAA